MNTYISEKKLQKIFNYYQKKYNLNTKIEFDNEGISCHYKHRIDFIEFGYCKINALYSSYKLKARIKGNLKKVIVFSLLHEIKHAIDKDLLKEEGKKVDWVRYIEDREYHDNLIPEKRADKFAKFELSKWGV